MDVIKDALVSILAIIGIIVAGGFVVFFLGDLLLSILDPNRDSKFKRKEKVEKEETFSLQPTQPVQPAHQPTVVNNAPTTFSFEEFESGIHTAPVVNNYYEAPTSQPFGYQNTQVVNNAPDLSGTTDIDFSRAAAEEAELKNEATEHSTVRDEDEEYRRQRLKAIEERRLALMKEFEEEEKAEKEEDEDDLFDLDDFDFDDDDDDEDDGKEFDPQEAYANAMKNSGKVAVNPKNLTDITAEKNEAIRLDQELIAKQEEIEALRRELELERERYIELEREKESIKESITTRIVSIPVGDRTSTIDELKERLAILSDRFKENLKQFKTCKKEYLPLMRVNKTLQNDMKKLRIKEARVAKQKVVLYGVNNYADIDEEKAKALAEDLDHLDGLKLSVKHCEEVMEKNKDRYPILETTYNILKLNNDTLKNDIAEIEAALAKYKEENEG